MEKIFLLRLDGRGTAHYRLSLDYQGGGVAGANGCWRSTVLLSGNQSDPETGMASSNACGRVDGVENPPGVTLPCAATNGAGLAVGWPVGLRADKDPPLVRPTVTGTLGRTLV
ncbi:MAG: hypothetical protein NTX13_15010 [Acidobacteria bacterium]|nr:hypothetical protein [Acidobacteriota bacterium]